MVPCRSSPSTPSPSDKSHLPAKSEEFVDIFIKIVQVRYDILCLDPIPSVTKSLLYKILAKKLELQQTVTWRPKSQSKGLGV